jgi:hypothetical protein
MSAIRAPRCSIGDLRHCELSRPPNQDRFLAELRERKCTRHAKCKHTMFQTVTSVSRNPGVAQYHQPGCFPPHRPETSPRVDPLPAPPETKMLTPKGEHFLSPCSTRGDVRWENHFRRNRNPPKTLVVGSYFLPASESSGNPAQFLGPLSCSYAPTCSNRRNLTLVARRRKRPRNSLRISFQYTHIKHFTKSKHGSFEVQGYHYLGLFAVAQQAHEHPETAQQKPRHGRKQQQYPNEFKNT